MIGALVGLNSGVGTAARRGVQRGQPKPPPPKAPAKTQFEKDLDVLNKYRPDYLSVADKDGNLQSRYALSALPDVQADQRAVNQMRTNALSQGPSEWARNQSQVLNMQNQNAMDQSAQRFAGQQAQAMGQMAMRGGINSGARERMARMGARDQALQNNQIARQGMQDQFNLNVQDQQFKRQDLQNVAGYDFQNANLGMQNRDYQAKVADTNRLALVNDLGGQNQYNMSKYQQIGAAYGANKTADAQRQAAQSGGGGGFLTNLINSIF